MKKVIGRAVQNILVLGGALTRIPHDMFPHILNTNDTVPVMPRHSKANWESTNKVANLERLGAAEAKRKRRADKLQKLEMNKAPGQPG